MRREIAAHPAKAAVLGVLCVVALWFWAPLLWGWFAPGGEAPAMVEAPPAAVPQLPGFPAAVAAPAKTSPPAPADYPWQQVVQWMEQDPRTQPVEPLPGGNEPAAASLAAWLPWSREESAGRDPFFPPELTEAAGVEEEVEPSTPPVVRPEDMGASVSAVVVGPDGGTAILNGRAYRKGEQVTFEKDGRAYVFTLAEIHHGGVVLMRDGMRHVLPMPRSSDAPKPSRGETELPVPHSLP
ncbi:MAG: hypothetical protein ACOCWL_04395 [Thermoguttaceae bacterium]